MKYKAIFFDLDGTLLNTLEDLTVSCNYALKKYNQQEVNIEQVRRAVGNGIRKLIERVLSPDSPKELVENCFSDFQKYYQTHVDVFTYPYEGIIDFLEYVKEKKLKTIIISNKFRLGVERLNDKFFKELIDLPLGPDEKLLCKPDLSMINYALEKFNLKKEEVLYIGDSGVDIETAKKAGFDMLTVTWGFRSKVELLELGHNDIHFVDDPKEIIEYLD